MRIETLEAPRDEGWDRYAMEHPLGTPFHLLSWKRSIERTFGFRSCYLMAREAGAVKGILPLFELWNPIQGRILLSTPFAVYGGILAEGDSAARALRDRVQALASERKVQFVELRNSDAAQCADWPVVQRYATFRQKIAPTPEDILGTLPRETRRMTRRALESGFEWSRTREPGRFVELYEANLRKLGTPAFPRKHFSTLLSEYPEADILEIRLGEKVAAAVLNLYFRDSVLPYYGASDPDFNRSNPNNMMYYQLMCLGAEQGLKTFDFGRSKLGSGAYAFKKHWGMEEIALPYEVLLVRRKELPNFSPTNEKYQRAIELWKRLPLGVTNRVGPFLIRLFP